jgi:putative hydrolase
MDRIKIDTHMHTIASGHAYHTLNEMINEAKKKEMDIICITEHGINMPGTCHEYYFSNYLVLKENKYFYEEADPVKVLFGVEANILNMQGEIDINLNNEINRKCLDIVIASIHNVTFSSPSPYIANMAIINAMKNPNIHIIGHPDDRDFNYREIVPAAKEYGKILELNNSSNNPSGFRKGAYKRDLEMLSLCKEYNVPISLGSDAHCKYDIGNFEYIIPILKEVDFPSELIINSSEENFKKYIMKK